MISRETDTCGSSLLCQRHETIRSLNTNRRGRNEDVTWLSLVFFPRCLIKHRTFVFIFQQQNENERVAFYFFIFFFFEAAAAETTFGATAAAFAVEDSCSNSFNCLSFSTFKLPKFDSNLRFLLNPRVCRSSSGAARSENWPMLASEYFAVAKAFFT